MGYAIATGKRNAVVAGLMVAALVGGGVSGTPGLAATESTGTAAVVGSSASSGGVGKAASADDVETIKAKDLAALLEQYDAEPEDGTGDEETEEIFLIDVRTFADYTKGTIEHAVSIPVKQIRLRIREIPADGLIVVFGKNTKQTKEAVESLLDEGIAVERIAMLDNGVKGWKASGNDLVKMIDVPVC